MKRKILGFVLLLSTGMLLGACSSKTDKIQEEGDQQEALMEQAEEEEQDEDGQETEDASDQKILLLRSGQKSVEGNVLRDTLQEAGYQVQVEYAEMDGEKQKEQLEAVKEDQVQAVVIEPVETDGMEEFLKEIDEAGIGIICYGRLFSDTEAVDAYVVNDYYDQGIQTGQQMEELRDLKDRTREEPVTMEVFLTEEENINDHVFYLGLMDVLSPYIEEGIVVSRAGRDTFPEMTVENGTKENARMLCEEILEEYYQDNAPDLVYVSDDAMTQGICSVLEMEEDAAAGDEGGEERTEQEGPLVIGQGFSLLTANRISTGRQVAAFCQDTEKLADCCLQALQDYFSGEESDDISREYDNGVEIVPAYTAESVWADASNYEDFLE